MMNLDISLDEEETGKHVRDTRICFFDLNPDETQPLSIITAGWELTARNYELERKDYPFPTIEFIESGSGIFTCEGKSHPLTANSILYYKSNKKYRITATNDTRLSKYWMSIAGTEADQFLKKADSFHSPVIQLKDSRHMHELFQQVIDYSERYDFTTGYETCLLVLKLILKRIDNDFQITTKQVSPAYVKYLNCVELMENNVRSLRTVNDLAAKANIDTSYLIRLFKRFDAETPYKRLIRLKTREAAENLLYTEHSIKEIAEEIGFEDQFVFSKCFKRVYGVSPKIFKRSFNSNAAGASSQPKRN